VVWSAAEDGSDAVIQSAFKPAGDALQTPSEIAETDENASNQLEPQVAVDPQGNALAVWEGLVDGNQVIQAAVRSDESGSWQAPVELSGSGAKASYPKVAVDSQGNAIAVWEQDEGGAAIVQAAGYDAGPLLYGPSIPSAGTVGQSLSFSADPPGVWSTLGEPAGASGMGPRRAKRASLTHTRLPAATR
jgi:hypothetical protein